MAIHGGIARENGLKAVEIGGVDDHAHVLVVIPPSCAVAKAVQLLKGVSSHWIKNEFPDAARFAWQDGYGAFTVSESQIDLVRHYIRGQSEHHCATTFAEEYRAFLERHHIAFDERYWLG